MFGIKYPQLSKPVSNSFTVQPCKFANSKTFFSLLVLSLAFASLLVASPGSPPSTLQTTRTWNVLIRAGCAGIADISSFAGVCYTQLLSTPMESV